jgi:dTDP-4-amino-4,6-dideoxygalactose transaminase
VIIPFNKAYLTGKELIYIEEACSKNKLSGDGEYTKKCHAWLESNTKSPKVLLTHSCTAALEMAAILVDIQPGDEVIMPSFTFVSTANAFVLRGGVPVFVDIRNDTLNIDENLIEEVITKKTKAIAVVHYAGVACEMNTIMAIAKRHDLKVIEDAAQGVMATYDKRALGSLGHIGAFSFHDTKNIVSGEGGAILLNQTEHIEPAEIIREKGTNRTSFMRGESNKYTWQSIGSSYLPSDITAAFLYAQFENAKKITALRVNIWKRYHKAFQGLENEGRVVRSVIPGLCEHNGHIYFMKLSSKAERDFFILYMSKKNIKCTSHYVPLHSSPFGKRYCKGHGTFPVTDNSSDTIVRLPIWPSLGNQQIKVIEETLNFFKTS